MLIICDHRAPDEAIQRLSNGGSVIRFNAKLLASSPLHGHPDIFMCQTPETLIVAPNSDAQLVCQLGLHKIPFVFGELPVEAHHPQISRYNAVVTKKVTICNPKTVDPKIMELSAGNTVVEVRQSYCRCSTVALSDTSFLTSDAKTDEQLRKHGFRSVWINPSAIRLQGYNHGLFGGCAGVLKEQNSLFLMGSLDVLTNKEEVFASIKESGLDLIELHQGPLVDVGGIFFLS